MNRVKTRRTHTLQILLFITDSAQREIQGFENKKKEREKFSFVVLVFLVIIRVGENKKFVVFSSSDDEDESIDRGPQSLLLIEAILSTLMVTEFANHFFSLVFCSFLKIHSFIR